MQILILHATVLFPAGAIGEKIPLVPEIQVFLAIFDLSPVSIRSITWVMSETPWVRCRV